MDRQMLRQKAKFEYKKMLKTLPKHQRVSFSRFFQTMKGTLATNATVGFSATSDKAAMVADDDMAYMDAILDPNTMPEIMVDEIIT